MLPPPIAAFALLTSTTVASVTLVTRMRACAVAGPVTIHGCVRSSGVLAAMSDHDVPPLRDTSIFTLPARPVDVQVTLCVLPIGHTSPPSGDVTLMLPPPSVAFALLASATVGSATLVTRIRAWVV